MTSNRSSGNKDALASAQAFYVRLMTEKGPDNNDHRTLGKQQRAKPPIFGRNKTPPRRQVSEAFQSAKQFSRDRMMVKQHDGPQQANKGASKSAHTSGGRNKTPRVLQVSEAFRTAEQFYQDRMVKQQRDGLLQANKSTAAAGSSSVEKSCLRPPAPTTPQAVAEPWSEWVPKPAINIFASVVALLLGQYAIVFFQSTLEVLIWCFCAIRNTGAVVIAFTLICFLFGRSLLHRLVTISENAKQQLQLDTTEMRERAYAELMAYAEVGVTVTAVRDSVMWTYLLEGESRARRRHLVKHVWPRVKKGIQEDNRTHKRIVRVGGEVHELWQWPQPGSSSNSSF